VFSTRYVAANLGALWSSGLPAIAALAAVLVAVARARRSTEDANGDAARLRAALEFFALGTLPLVALYLLYFFPWTRFYLSAIAVAAAIAGALLGRWCAALPRAALAPLLAVVLAGVAAWRAQAPDPPPQRRLAAERIRSATPPHAIVITGIEPAYLEMIVGGGRRFVPISRRIEYASKLIAPEKIPDPDPPPRNAFDHRSEGLRRGGALEAVSAVAGEQLDELEREVRSGTPVFLDISALYAQDEPVGGELLRRFRLVPKGEELFELAPL